MEILFLSPYFPCPPLGGGKTRIYATIRYLAERHTVDFISFASKREMKFLPDLQQFCRHVELIPQCRPRSLTPRAFLTKLHVLLFHTVPFEENTDVKGRIVKLLSMHDYDLIQIEGPYMVPYVQNLSFPPTLLDTIGLGFPWNYRELLYEESKLGVFIKWIKVFKYQRAIGRICKGALVSSEEDFTRLRTLHPHLDIHIIENGVDCHYFSPCPEEDTQEVIFTGAMDYFPNVDAVRYFCQRIYPLIKRNIPGVKFLIVGRDPPDGIKALQGDPSITVTGYVEDTRPFFARSTVVVVPMRLGAGTRIKILEALAMGKAVVSTTVGVEGIQVTIGRDLLIADDPEEFAQAVIRLLKDRDLRRTLGMNGRKCVEEHYQWERCLAPLETVYRRLGAYS